MEHERIYAVNRLLNEYVQSPSLSRIRHSDNITRLAKAIIESVDRASAIWQKWDGPRDEVVKAASPCWVPVEDLRAFLDTLPGPPLTVTDVNQRLRAIWEEPYTRYPNDEVKAGCLALYERERAAGTEMMAIIGAIQEFIEVEEERIGREKEERYRAAQKAEKERQQAVFLSGADCGWTSLEGRRGFYCRKNGRAFRTDQDANKRWRLYRIQDTGDEGNLLGTYQGRGDANKALKGIAYAPEPRW